MKTKIFFIFLILVLPFAIYPQNSNTKEYVAKDYEKIVEKLNNGDTSVDFTVLRLAFTKTKEYSYHGPEKKEREVFSKPFSEKNYKESLKQVEKYLEKNYVDANAHFIAYSSAKELKDDQKAEFYKTVLVGLLKSIQNGNDGLSMKTPFSVITIDEEYTMMRFLGYQFSSQSLQAAEGHQFDVFEVTNVKTNEKTKLYFNIDIVWKAESEIFGK